MPSPCPWPNGGPGPLESGSGDFEVSSVIFYTCCCDLGPVSLRSPPSSALCRLSAGQSSPGGCCSLLCRPTSSLVLSSVGPRHVFTLCAVWLSSCLSSPLPSTFWAVSSTTFSPSLCFLHRVFLECVSFLMACLPVAVTSALPCGVTGLRRPFQPGEAGVGVGVTFTGLSDSGGNPSG